MNYHNKNLRLIYLYIFEIMEQKEYKKKNNKSLKFNNLKIYAIVLVFFLVNSRPTVLLLKLRNKHYHDKKVLQIMNNRNGNLETYPYMF